MNFDKILKDALKDIQVELMDEFDKNFERKAFFDRQWADSGSSNKRGSTMMRSGKLRRSIRGQVRGSSIVFNSSVPYAAIHNEGGEITVTAKMKKYFWAMYYKASNAVVYKVKTKEAAKTKKNVSLTKEAEQWKAMALKKIGDKVKIEQRQFIGWHDSLNPAIENILQKHLDNGLKDITQKLQPKLK